MSSTRWGLLTVNSVDKVVGYCSPAATALTLSVGATLHDEVSVPDPEAWRLEGRHRASESLPRSRAQRFGFSQEQRSSGLT